MRRHIPSCWLRGEEEGGRGLGSKKGRREGKNDVGTRSMRVCADSEAGPTLETLERREGVAMDCVFSLGPPVLRRGEGRAGEVLLWRFCTPDEFLTPILPICLARGGWFFLFIVACRCTAHQRLAVSCTASCLQQPTKRCRLR